jgi:DNA polymerase III subunit delta
MIIKLNELKNFKKDKINYYLLYGPNQGLINETIDTIFKPVFSKNIVSYDEKEILNKEEEFKENIFNKSFFEVDKLIIINRATDKILTLLKEIINVDLEDIKIILKAGLLEKKSKLRNFIEKEKKAAISAFYEDNLQTLSALALNFFKEKKIKISNEDINFIIERSGGDRIHLNNELEKISNFTKEGQSVSKRVVKRLTNFNENYEILKLVDYCLVKNKKKITNLLNENYLNNDENTLILKTFLYKLKRLKKLKVNIENNSNIDHTLSTYKPPIFWKDKEIIKQQLKTLSLNEINELIKSLNNLELVVKKNLQLSSQIINNFMLGTVLNTNNLI